ncbi:SDR family NAD(P)-dependent oxidoreductase [Kitasatospora sp. NPDC058190]|uniref:SDR family NAD(P)-dependent oxidoreductase n=1 Tax=Kitasatospora sp. NPDC058190 TaxID=3346371 RepID=UPI0036DEBF3C
MCSTTGHRWPLVSLRSKIKPADFDRILAVNTRGQLFAVQHAVPHMRQGGRIVLTSSVSASRAFFRHTLYAANKAAVESMVLNLSAWLDTAVALRRLAEPTEIAAGYAFLASDDAAFMTGRTLQLDGGMF